MAGSNATNFNPSFKGSPYNALMFLVENAIAGRVNTMVPVRVVSVDSGGANSPTGTVNVRPLVTQKDGNGNMIGVSELYHLPYSRIQGGVAALVIDPLPGDMGIAVFAQQDTSTITKDTQEPILPSTYMAFPMSSGWYIGGFLNQTPSVYVEVQQSAIVINAQSDVTINAPSKIRLNTPLVEITGKIVQTGESASGASTRGGLTNTGGTISSNGIVLDTHVHGGVESGGSTTSGPQ